MAEKDSFIDRTEAYLPSPHKQKLNKKGTTILLTEDENQNTGTSVDSAQDGTRKRRISSTSWQVKKTTEITDEVQTGQKVTTMQFDVGESGAISPGVDSNKPSFVSSSSFEVGFNKENDKVFGAGKDDSDPSEDYVFIESTDLGFVDRTEITEIQDQQESVAPEAKKSYFAYLLDQNTAESGKANDAESSKDESSAGASEDVAQSKEDDATKYERITYTPGLAIRSYAVEEMQTKKNGDSPERTEDAENNNIAAEAAQGGDSEGTLTPAEGYRISQIIAVQETELWEQERLRKEREEYSIIDTLSMDDMMKMLGEHDRMNFEAQVPDHFPITGIPSDDQFRTELRTRTVREQASMVNGGNHGSQDTYSKLSDAPDSVRRIQSVNNNSVEAQISESRSTIAQSKSGTESGMKTDIKKSEETVVVSNTPLQSESSEKLFSQTAQSVKQIRTASSTVEQSQIERSIADSPGSTTAALESRQTESASSTLEQSTISATQELKMKFKSVADAEQSASINIRSAQSEASLEGGVTNVMPQKQIGVQSRPPKDEPPIEVERKFNITADTESQIKCLGGKLVKERTFTDIYYDDSDYTLTLSDCWLRQRDSKWEMKAASDSHKDFALQYKEITKEKEILNYLKNSLKISLNVSYLSEIFKTADLSEFATITTTRKSYKLSGCSIDLDLTDHGFQVGEIEVMAPSASEVPAALKTIENVAKNLGLSLLRLV